MEGGFRRVQIPVTEFSISHFQIDKADILTLISDGILEVQDKGPSLWFRVGISMGSRDEGSVLDVHCLRVLRIQCINGGRDQETVRYQALRQRITEAFISVAVALCDCYGRLYLCAESNFSWRPS